MREHKAKHTHLIDASHGLTITQHIDADQLEQLEKTYRHMLDAITEARKQKTKAAKQSAEIIRHGVAGLILYERRCLKIACLVRRGCKVKNIDSRFGTRHGYCLNRCMASHGRALLKERIRKAKKLLVIKLVNSGHGIRPTSRLIPQELGACSPALVCKIIKAYKLSSQPALPFALYAVEKPDQKAA